MVVVVTTLLYISYLFLETKIPDLTEQYEFVSVERLVFGVN